MSLFADFVFPETFWVGAGATFLFGFIGLFLLFAGYKIFDKWMTPKLDVEAELVKGNNAVAIVVAALIFSVAYLASHVVH